MSDDYEQLTVDRRQCLSDWLDDSHSIFEPLDVEFVDHPEEERPAQGPKILRAAVLITEFEDIEGATMICVTRSLAMTPHHADGLLWGALNR